MPHSEPTLSDLLEEPIVQQLMERDGIRRSSLELLIDDMNRVRRKPGAPPRAEEILASWW